MGIEKAKGMPLYRKRLTVEPERIVLKAYEKEILSLDGLGMETVEEFLL